MIAEERKSEFPIQKLDQRSRYAAVDKRVWTLEDHALVKQVIECCNEMLRWKQRWQTLKAEIQRRYKNVALEHKPSYAWILNLIEDLEGK